MSDQTDMREKTEDNVYQMPSEETLLKNTSRQRLRKEAKQNRKKMSAEMKTLSRPLKVGEFVQYTRQQEGVLGFIHKFLQEIHPEEYKSFIEKIQNEEKERKKPQTAEIEQAEADEQLEANGEAATKIAQIEENIENGENNE